MGSVLEMNLRIERRTKTIVVYRVFHLKQEGYSNTTTGSRGRLVWSSEGVYSG